MSAELVIRLRNHTEQQQAGGGYWWETPEVCAEAAERIEFLERQVHEAIVEGMRIATIVPIEEVPDAMEKARANLIADTQSLVHQ